MYYCCRSNNFTIVICFFSNDCGRFTTDFRSYSLTRSEKIFNQFFVWLYFFLILQKFSAKFCVFFAEKNKFLFTVWFIFLFLFYFLLILFSSVFLFLFYTVFDFCFSLFSSQFYSLLSVLSLLFLASGLRFFCRKQ